MDIVLGVSLAPPTVRLVLVEGENANGVTVDQDDFTVEDTEAATDRVVSAVLGTRESAGAGGYRLTSAGVMVTDQAQATALRDALAAHKVENVMLVSAFLAAAALAQTVGGALGQERTALLFVEPSAATVAVVDSADGSILEAHHRVLPGDDDEALTELSTLVAGIDRLDSDPDGVFVVGSGVNVAMIKPTLEASTPLAVSAPEEPEMALARGAALASAQAPLFASSTRAVAWARDPGTGEVDKNLANLQYAYVPAGRDDYDDALAYSAVGDEDEAPTTAFDVDEQRRIPLLLAGSALVTLVVIGVVALVVALASEMRPSANLRPNAGGNVIAPTQRAPVPQPAPPPSASPPPPPSAPAPAPPSAPAPAYTPPPAPAYTPPPTPAYTPPPTPAYTPPPAAVPRTIPPQPVHRAPAYTPPPAAAPSPAPEPAAPPAPPPEPAAPPPPPAPQLPQMPPMTMWLHLPFVSVPIPLNPPPPPAP